MFQAVYERPVDRKPACRRRLFPQGEFSSDQVLSCQDRCLSHLCPWLPMELLTCHDCRPGRHPQKGMVSMCPVPTKATRDSLVSSSGSSVKRSKTFDLFPELWDFLTSRASPDGSVRQGGKISLSCEQGVWSLVLTDPSTSLYACLSGQDLEDLLLMTEARLAESTLPWRPSNFSPKGKGR